MRILVTVVVFYSVLFAPVASADKLRVGIAAYDAQTYSKSARLLKPLAENGNDIAQLYVGYMYEEGKGLPKNYQLALKWFKSATKQGNRDAEYWMGNMYAKGKGVKKNMREAAKWYLKAAHKNHAMAQQRVAYMYQSCQKAMKRQKNGPIGPPITTNKTPTLNTAKEPLQNTI